MQSSFRVGREAPLTSIFPSCRGERRFEKSARRDGGMESGEGSSQALEVFERRGEG